MLTLRCRALITDTPYGFPMHEDCLTLNIATPSNNSGKLPVMVWFHGGAYVIGAGANYRNDALVHASEQDSPVVVVTINYRLFVFGFLGGAALQASSSSAAASASASSAAAPRTDARADVQSTGNFGIDDQRLALRWVKQHISSFGGDPAMVTIFGESAGGNSVITHLVERESFGLYHRAISQSGTYAGAIPRDEAEATYEAVLKRTGCADAECLRRLSPMRLITAVPEGTQFGPVIDGVALSGDPYELLDTGAYYHSVPVLLGHNREEAAAFLPRLIPTPADRFTAGDWLKVLEGFSRGGLTLNASGIAEVQRLYANGTFAYPRVRGNQTFYWWAAVASASDAEFGLGHCSVRRVARMLAKGGTRTFAYLFAHPAQRDLTDGTYGWRLTKGGFSTPGNTACPHASEIVYAFGDAKAVTPGEEAELAVSMGKLWASFASHGAPPAGVNWPPYASHAAANDTFFVLDVASAGGMRPEQAIEEAQCPFWDRQRPVRMPQLVSELPY
jgi:para-nitrobenzyl esterase